MISNLKEIQDLLFNNGRSHNGWIEKDVPDDYLTQIFDMVKMGSTSFNSLPLRIIFLKSTEAKEQLKPFLMQGNIDKSMKAPVVAILGFDLEFYEHFKKFGVPTMDVRSIFAGNDSLIYDTAFRNSSIQIGYFILAARMLGLDLAPMSGFFNDKVDETFFKGANIKSNIICGIGYGDSTKLYPRLPRPKFEDFCSIK